MVLGPFRTGTPEISAPMQSEVSNAGLAHLAQLPAALQHLELLLIETNVPDAWGKASHRT